MRGNRDDNCIVLPAFASFLFLCLKQFFAIKIFSMFAMATARHSIFLNKKPPFGDFLLTKIGGGGMLALIGQKINNYSPNLCTMSKCIKQNGYDFTSG